MIVSGMFPVWFFQTVGPLLGGVVAAFAFRLVGMASTPKVTADELRPATSTSEGLLMPIRSLLLAGRTGLAFSLRADAALAGPRTAQITELGKLLSRSPGIGPVTTGTPVATSTADASRRQECLLTAAATAVDGAKQSVETVPRLGSGQHPNDNRVDGEDGTGEKAHPLDQSDDQAYTRCIEETRKLIKG